VPPVHPSYSPRARDLLTLPNSIIVERVRRVKRLGLDNTEGKAKINGKEVKLAGTVKGLKSLAAAVGAVLAAHRPQSAGLLLPSDQ